MDLPSPRYGVTARSMSMTFSRVLPSTRYSRTGKVFTACAPVGAEGSADRAMSSDCSTEIAMIPQNLLDAINGTLYSSSLAKHQIYGSKKRNANAGDARADSDDAH